MRYPAALLILATALPSAALAFWQASPGLETAAREAEAKRPAFTLDTPIQQLAADAGARAVLDRELPGLTAHARYEQFKGISLKALKPFSGGLITDERLQAVEASLKTLQTPVD